MSLHVNSETYSGPHNKVDPLLIKDNLKSSNKHWTFFTFWNGFKAYFRQIKGTLLIPLYSGDPSISLYCTAKPNVEHRCCTIFILFYVKTKHWNVQETEFLPPTILYTCLYSVCTLCNLMYNISEHVNKYKHMCILSEL